MDLRRIREDKVGRSYRFGTPHRNRVDDYVDLAEVSPEPPNEPGFPWVRDSLPADPSVEVSDGG